VPLLDGHILTQSLIAFAAIAVLGLVLRWTFSREVRQPPPTPGDRGALDVVSEGDPPVRPRGELPRHRGAPRLGRLPAIGRAQSPQGLRSTGTPNGDDFGLLAPVAVTDTADEAHRLRGVLAAADIRATTARTRGGHHVVLVFAVELDRARRVGGWSA
jgi:hypothetical protein